MEIKLQQVFNKDALFSDGTRYYRTPEEPKAGDKVTISFPHTENNAEEYICCMKARSSGWKCTGQREDLTITKRTLSWGTSVFGII